MFDRRIKYLYFVFEGLGSLACGFYSSYKFFLLQSQYGLGDLGNLGAAVLQGLVIALASWQGGRFAQQHGYYKSMILGLVGMSTSLVVGGLVQDLAIQLLVLAAWAISTCLVWPALEALVSEGEDASSLPRMLGIYNVVWATCSALSYFFGGYLFDHLGVRSIFWVPVCVFSLMFCLVVWLARKRPVTPQQVPGVPNHSNMPAARALLKPTNPRIFLQMAWLANPFAFIGINTVLALVPGLAREFHLSVTYSGFFCSLWFFARLAAFIGLWRWQGWHYRFRWLLAAFLGLLTGFVALLIGHDFLTLILGQIIFGLSVGLLYYSSLFYSMDVGDTKGEHGGLHEAAIGVGNCVGPAVGAAALLIAPGIENAGAYAVSGLLTIGLVALLGLRIRTLRFTSNVSNSTGQGGNS